MPVAKPKLDPAVEEFYTQLIEKGGLSAEETDLLNSLLSNEKVATEFKSGIHGRRMTDRTMDQLKKDKAALEEQYSTKLSELETLRETLADTSTMDKEGRDDLKRRIHAREQQLLKIVQKAKEYSNGDEFLKEVGLTDLESVIATPPSASKQETSVNKYPTKEELLKDIEDTLSTNAQALARLPFDLLEMQMEYKQLTGKDLNPVEFFTKIREDKTGNYRAVYEKEYDIPNLREAKKVEAIEARIRKEYDEKLEAERAKLALPNEQRSAATSVFYQQMEATRPKEDNAPANNANSVLADAVADFEKRRSKAEAA